MHKKTIKKSIALLLILIMTVAFTACGNGNNEGGNGEGNESKGLDLETLYSGISEETAMVSVDEFVDEDVISYQKGRLHRSGWYLVSLNHKGPYEERDNQGDDDGLDIFLKL